MSTTSSPIDKIRKLLSLADGTKNDSLEEANTALKMAHRLMAEHNLTMTQVMADWEDKIKIVSIDYKCRYDYYKNWEFDVAAAIVKYFGCQVLKTKRKTYSTDESGKLIKTKKGTHALHYLLTISGPEHLAAECEFVIASYCNRINDLAWKSWSANKSQFSNQAKYTTSFCVGAAQGIHTVLSNQLSSDCTSVIPVLKKEIEEHYVESGWHISEVKTRDIERDSEALVNGYNEVQSITIQKAI